MEKYALLRRRVVETGLAARFGIAEPPAATDEELERAHDPGHVHRAIRGELAAPELRRIGFPWSPELVERCRRSVGATVAAAQAALREGVGVNLAGGTHHAFADRGEGYCVFNDVAVAARSILAEEPEARIAVVDLDVHQGNGTAAIFRDDPRVFTLSVHGSGNFPFHKEEGDLDLALPDGAGDTAYLDAVRQGIDAALDHRPELVFFLAGADPFEGDRLGRLAVTRPGLAERDRLLVQGCAARGIPVVVVMAGGYGHDIRETVEIHLHAVRTALEGGTGRRR